MAFETGNSGNKLFEAVVKIGPGASQEAEYCRLLGMDVCPEIYAIWTDGYCMEKLIPCQRFPELLHYIQILLESKVWNRPAIPTSMDIDWREKLKIYGIETPDYIEPTEYCMVHGDPTASNALLRGSNIIMCDPRAPRDYIPQCRETDLGRLLQSSLGWETVAYGLKPLVMYEPIFRDKRERIKSMFWCGAAAARIEYLERSREKRSRILDWCGAVRRLCGV